MGVVPRLQAWPGHSGEHRRESPVRTDKAILDGSNEHVGAAGDLGNMNELSDARGVIFLYALCGVRNIKRRK